MAGFSLTAIAATLIPLIGGIVAIWVKFRKSNDDSSMAQIERKKATEAMYLAVINKSVEDAKQAVLAAHADLDYAKSQLSQSRDKADVLREIMTNFRAELLEVINVAQGTRSLESKRAYFISKLQHIHEGSKLPSRSESSYNEDF